MKMNLPALRRRNCIFIIALVCLPFSIFVFITGTDVSREVALVQRLAEMQVRLQYVESVYRTHQEDVPTIEQATRAPLPTSVRSLLGNMTGYRAASGFNDNNFKSLHFPTVFYFLPHLLNDPSSTKPAYLMSRGRSGVSIVLGVPTVRRDKQNYLMSTLQNLIEAMTASEAADTLIVVFVAETDLEYVLQTAKQIENSFPQHVESGLIEVLSPPESYYPDMEKLKQTLGDPMERVKWRTKQNLDFVFLMTYSQPKGTFYVQLEDDILAKHGFITIMKNYALEITLKKPQWFVLDFCQLGFIGKMFKSAELPWAITFFQMFFNDKPVDWLLDYLIITKSCNFVEKGNKQCKQDKSLVWDHYKPSLFQHIGIYSSLKGKIQKLKDKQFGKVPLYFPHSNPPLNHITSDIRAYKQFTLERAYEGQSYFWGLFPQQGDHLTFIFQNSIMLSRYLLRSGNVEHLSDKFANTTVEIMPSNKLPNNYTLASDGYLTIGRFDSLGLAEGTIDPLIGKISSFRLTVNSDSENWVILSEIFFEEFKES